MHVKELKAFQFDVRELGLTNFSRNWPLGNKRSNASGENAEKALSVMHVIRIWHSDLQKMAHSAAKLIGLTLKT